MSKFSAKNVCVSYKGGAYAIRQFDLDFCGDTLAIYGAECDGKTTLIKALAGLCSYSGDFYLDEEKIENASSNDFRFAVLEDFCLIKNKTVYENLAYPLKIRNISQENISFLLENVISEFGLKPYLDIKIKQLSKTLYPYISLARIGLLQRKLYLFDNPFVNLARQSKSDCQKKLGEIFSKTQGLKIFATSDFYEACLFGEKVCILYGGVIEQYGTPQDIKNNPTSVRVAELCTNNNTIFEFATLLSYDDGLKLKQKDGDVFLDASYKARLVDLSYIGCEVLVAKYEPANCYLLMDTETERSILI